MSSSNRGAPSPRSPLPRRDAIVDLLASQKRALHANEIAARLSVSERHYPALQRMLDDLSFDGSIAALPGQRFKLARAQVEQRGATHTGVLTVHPRGFGFVAVPGQSDDVFVQPEGMRGAMHGDLVTVRVVTRSRRGVEGEIVSIERRRTVRVAGILRRRGKSAWVEPDDSRVRGPVVLAADDELARRGQEGEAVVAALERYPESPDENPEGRLVAVLGAPGDPNVEVAKVLVREGIDEPHPPEAVAEAEAFGPEVAAEALAGREDLTGIPLPTIDPEDARDHDDAVWAERRDDGGYRAWIAIADVSHYVKPGTALDAAALLRGNSIYLPDRAIPMLPRALSSNLCSLLPDVVRLCLCVIVDLDAQGEPRHAEIVEGFMRSRAKLTYQKVARALGFTDEGERDPAAEAMREDLVVAWDLARLLRGRRMRRGALDLDLPEAKVVLDKETGAPVDVEKRTRDPGVAKAYQLIEELMLLANETVARWLVDRSVPTVFRVHAPPDQAKLVRFATLAAELDLPFDVEDAADPKRLSKVLKKMDAHPQKHVLHMLLLRAMKQATYDTGNIGHFGLASSAYLHFTSPIRRYPDLLVHRAVRALLQGKKRANEGDAERLQEAAVTASQTERKAMEVEREVVDLYRALLMRSHVGETFEGTVTGLVGSGLFVAIDAPFVDVLVRLDALGPDTYELDDEGLRAIGVRSGDRIAIGDRMMVLIEDVQILRRTVYGRRVVVASDEPPVERHGRRGRGAPPERAGRKVRATRSTTEPPPRPQRTGGKKHGPKRGTKPGRKRR